MRECLNREANALTSTFTVPTCNETAINHRRDLLFNEILNFRNAKHIWNRQWYWPAAYTIKKWRLDGWTQGCLMTRQMFTFYAVIEKKKCILYWILLTFVCTETNWLYIGRWHLGLKQFTRAECVEPKHHRKHTQHKLAYTWIDCVVLDGVALLRQLGLKYYSNCHAYKYHWEWKTNYFGFAFGNRVIHFQISSSIGRKMCVTCLLSMVEGVTRSDLVEKCFCQPGNKKRKIFPFVGR